MKKVGFFLLLVTMVFIAGCLTTRDAGVNVSFKDHDKPSSSPLIINFTRSLFEPNVKMIMDSLPLIEFEPEIKGRFVWLSDKTLAFYPFSPLQPGIEYKALLTSRLKQITKKNLPDEVIFSTPQFKAEIKRTWWGIVDGDTKLFAQIKFNYPVDPESMESLVKVKSADNNLSFRFIDKKPAHEFILELSGSNLPLEGGTIDFAMESGFSSSVGGASFREEAVVQGSVSPSSSFSIDQQEVILDGNKWIVRFLMNQTPSEDNAKELITAYPEMELTFSVISGGLEITGPFVQGATAEFRFDENYRSQSGVKFGSTQWKSVVFATTGSFIGFTDQQSLYLGAKGRASLGLMVDKVERVKVSVYRIFENNLLHYLRNGQQYNYHEIEGHWVDFYGWLADEGYGDIVFEKVMDVGALPTHGEQRLLPLEVDALLNSKGDGGMYVVTVSSEEQPWIRDTRLVALSDIGLMAIRQGEDLMIWAFSIKTAEPRSGVNVKVISRSNQVLFSGTTNDDGSLLYKREGNAANLSPYVMITAKQNEDFNAMLLANSIVETSRFDMTGRPALMEAYDAFIYGPRDIYRPGDSLFAVGLVRDRAGKVASSLPVTFRLLGPSGQVISSQIGTTDNAGVLSLKTKISKNQLTGRYNLVLLSADDRVIGQRSLLIEEFVPDRMEVKLKLNKASFNSGDSVILNLSAATLFGTSAPNRLVEAELSLSPAQISSPDFSNYNFSITDKLSRVALTQVIQTKTNGLGVSRVTYRLPDNRGTGLWGGSVTATVFDENNRPMIRQLPFMLSTQSVYVGIGLGQNWVSTGVAYPVNLVTVDQNGKFVANSKIKVQVYRKEWQTVLESDGGANRYRSFSKDLLIDDRFVVVSKPGVAFSFTPGVSGEYVIRASVPGSEAVVESSIWAWGEGNSVASSFGVERDGKIEIESDKAEYQVGDKAKLLFRTPFDGLINIAYLGANGILNHTQIKAENRSASVSLNLSKTGVPNVWVSATLIRPMDDSQVPLTVAHGIVNLRVVNHENSQKLEIIANDKSGSSTTQEVTVKAKAGSMLTLAVVDEGILQLTSYKTPDPYSWFYGPLAFSAEWWDIYKYLYPELAPDFSSSGGDMAMARRINPFKNSQQAPLSWWSGVKKVPSNGVIKFRVPIPAFSGKVRLMAVASNENSCASAEKWMTIADPVVISIGTPAFLAPEDSLSFPITLTNTTSGLLSLNPMVKCTGPVKLKYTGSSFMIRPGEEKQIPLSLVADHSIGEASLTVSVNVGGKTYPITQNFSVRPVTGPFREAEAGTLEAGKSITVKSKGAWIKGSVESNIWMSTNPSGEYWSYYGDLLRYPHGCTEQVISIAFPRLYYGLKGDGSKEGRTIGVIKEALNLIQANQIQDGGLSYWPGANQSDLWLSVYGLHFMVDAKAHGFDLNKDVFDRLLRFVKNRIAGHPQSIYSFKTPNGNLLTGKYTSREIPYALFVLSLMGEPSIPDINYYKDERSTLTAEGRVVMAASALLAGDKQGYSYLLPYRQTLPEVIKTTGGSLNSDVSSAALSLIAMTKANPSDGLTITLSELLKKRLVKESYLSTQERALSLVALGGLSATNKDSKVSATVSLADGSVIKYTEGDLMQSLKKEITPFKIVTTGSGRLYYSWDVSGASAIERPAENRFIAVSRQILDRWGAPVHQGKLKKGDLVVVKVSLVSTLNTTISNVALTELLPACFEVENPRLQPGRDYSWMKTSSEMQYMDLRHDRITWFATATPVVKSFYYLARVTASGSFSGGSTYAEAMYDGQYFSNQPFNRIKVD